MLITNNIKIKSILEKKIVTLFIILFTIVGRIIQVIFLFNIRSDRSHQMLATQNFLSGHGISLAGVSPDNLSETLYQPLINWPPGYSLLFAPFYSLFNHNYIVAGLTLEILFAILLIFITRAILKKINVQLYLVNIYTLLTGFICYAFYFKPSSDAIAITFFMLAFYFTLSLLETNKHTNIKIAGLIIALFFSASVKYLFMPVVFIIPLFLILKGIVDNDLPIKKIGIVSILVLGGLLGALLLYHKSISGSAVYITQTTRGFFPENLLNIYPAIPAALLNPETTGFILNKSALYDSSIYRCYQWIHLTAALVAVLGGLWMVYKQGFKKLSAVRVFFFLSFFVSLAIIILLMLLSVRVAKEDGWWTYVQEARYYGLIILLLQLSFFIFYSSYRENLTRHFKYAFIIVLLIMLPDMFRGMAFSGKRITNFGKEEYSWQTELKIQKYADSIIKKESKKYPVQKTVLAGSSGYMNNRICLYNHIPILNDTYKINHLSSIDTKIPVLLLIMLRSDALPGFQSFLADPRKEVAGYMNGFYFYTVYVTPH